MSLHSGGMNSATAFFEMTFKLLHDEQTGVGPQNTDAAFAVSFYCNTGQALYRQDDMDEDALIMFSEAVRNGKEYLGSHIMALWH